MRNIIDKLAITTAVISSLFITSCTEEYDLEDRGLSVAELPNYVAFDAPGADAVLDPYEVEEDDVSEEVNVEAVGGFLSDVTVQYSLGGTAVFGEDYTIDGATAQGGTLVITHKQNTNAADQIWNNEDIVVNISDSDDVEDGERIIVITLTSATIDGTEVAIGRGGLDFLTQATVIISDDSDDD